MAAVREIRDRERKRYELHVGDNPGLRLLRLYGRHWLKGKILVGEANLVPQGDGEILLGNWFIEPAYRGAGLGSALLEAAINLAREQEGRLLFGNIAAKDLHDTPGLIPLYQAHGFQVCAPREPQWEHSVELSL